ncbi:YggS family pyridoxal phosphate-dependent enzyme [Caldanaerobius polysaccharolyticus]|uniref:YggS family pyridoxal phosphate-dependent enzyme n=1 Tax=Caldanaerobius polysaccharolyticus TaxID=44256 RepID=UPI000A0529F5|nr:YggS family pyridoxal phosphate-dependent enzyme [Caldanaerobius polysaccharolyticus]
MDVRTNIEAIKSNIQRACKKAGRDPSEVTIMAVTKTIPVERIKEAIACGIKVIGENRVQELVKKYPLIGGDVKWHMIGHLQVNKVKYIVDKVELIHSLDSVKLAQEIDKRAKAIGKRQNVLIEINIGGEDTKYGIKPEELGDFIKQIEGFENLCVQGLMTVAPIVTAPEDVRPYFKKMKQLYDELKDMKSRIIDARYLSMGMTSDYVVAVEEGANIVRIGTGIFGPRNYDK